MNETIYFFQSGSGELTLQIEPKKIDIIKNKVEKRPEHTHTTYTPWYTVHSGYVLRCGVKKQ